MSEKSKGGRPPVENPLKAVRGVRFTESEDAEVARAAKAAGVPVARWIREAALERARAQRP